MIQKSRPTIMDTQKGVCYICGKYCLTHKHHIYGGANRRNSEALGLYVHLCPDCHNMGPNSVHTNILMARWLQEEGQWKYEETHSREEFMRVFGRNYIDE